MTTITHNQLSAYLDKAAGEKRAAVYLIYGEDMLVQQTLNQLLDNLTKSAHRDICCEVMDGLAENIPDALEQMNTFGLLAGPKIVILKEAQLFGNHGKHERLVQQIETYFQEDNSAKAAKSFLQLCNRLGLEFDDLSIGAKIPKEIQTLKQIIGNDGIDNLIEHCQIHGWTSTTSGDHLNTLQSAIEKGFPASHYLILTSADKVLKRDPLAKIIDNHGLIIDCAVPLGERRADKTVQETVLRQTLNAALHRSGKKLQPELFHHLCDLTGFDLRTFAQNIEKLIDYTGERCQITAEDIQTVLKRTKTDPIFQLTNAIGERNAVQALFYMQSLLDSELHPLQILAAIVNQIRRLLIAKDFTCSEHGTTWRAGISYQQFQRDVLPAVQAHDDQINQQVEIWQTPEQTSAGGKKSRSKKAGKKTGRDWILAPNIKSAYPVYQNLLKSDKYSRQELLQALILLNRTDLQLKTSSQYPVLVLKRLILAICTPKHT